MAYNLAIISHFTDPFEVVKLCHALFCGNVSDDSRNKTIMKKTNKIS